MDPFAQELLNAGRRAHDPTPDDRQRVRAKLATRIAAAAAAAAGATKPVGVGGSMLLKTWLSMALLVVAAGYSATRATPVAEGMERAGPPSITAPAGDPAVTGAAPDAPAIEPGPAFAATTPALPAPSPAGAAGVSGAPGANAPGGFAAPRPPPSASGDLEGEMALLANAQAAIQRGDFATALARLEEHRRTYPRGMLGEERAAAQIIALCGAGRTGEARALGAAFLARHATSPLAPRVRGSCAAP
jgi:hypothetical protein